MKVILIDLANKAEVSKSTAFQHINGRYKYMSANTKARIKEAIDKLGFIPNQIARRLPRPSKSLWAPS